jgi:hypothetical protein
MDQVMICRKCGGVRAWISSEMPKARQVKFAADCVKRGYRLEERETESVRGGKWCDGHEAVAPVPATLFDAAVDP